MIIPLLVVSVLLFIYIILLLNLLRRLSPEKAFTKIIGDVHDKNTASILREIEKKPNKTAQDHYILATLYRHNPAPGLSVGEQRQKARENYQRMAETIARNPGQSGRSKIFQPRVALQYATDYFATLAPREIAEQRVLWATLQQAQTGLTATDAANAAAAKKELGNAVGTQKYFEEKVAWTNDPQNVHDSGVNRDMKAKFDTLRAENGDIDVQHFRRDAQAAIESLPLEQRQKTMRVWDSITQYGASTPMTSIGAPEIELWAHIWKRGENNQELRKATLTAMAECAENGHVVCTTGRAARAISAMTLLDTNPILATPAKTFEMIRNEVFEKSAALFKDSLETKGEQFIMAYNAGNTSEGETAEFERDVKEKIALHAAETYRDSLAPEQLEKIIVEAQAGI